MRVTEKGQVTIPKRIRDKLGIKPGSEVEFVESADGGVDLVVAGEASEKNLAALRFARWIDKIVVTGDSGMSAEDVMAATRDRDGRDPG